MLLIQCPWCGERAESEFHYGGEADIARPVENAGMDNRAWGDYVFMRRNTFGLLREQWVHLHGCRRWFIVERDTRTYEITKVETFGHGQEATR
ncbi:Sarcosine oxidase subunit delta OS=Castellaniella defragrans OX=75697 GN=HNR28_002016 PE=4 SV=1 [Castellaniella defragrans]